MGVRMKGRFIDAVGNPRKNCTLTVVYRGQTVDTFRVSGTFDETTAVRPSAADPLTVRGSCYGTRAAFEKEIRPDGEKLNTAVDLGDVVFP